MGITRQILDHIPRIKARARRDEDYPLTTTRSGNALREVLGQDCIDLPEPEAGSQHEARESESAGPLAPGRAIPFPDRPRYDEGCAQQRDGCPCGVEIPVAPAMPLVHWNQPVE